MINTPSLITINNMKQFLLFITILAFCCQSTYSQAGIGVYYESDPQGNYKFYCKNANYCNYLVEITLPQVINLRSSVSFPFTKEVKPGNTFLFELRIERVETFSTFNYTTKYFKGCINPDVLTNFTYLLPIKPGNATEAFELKYLRIGAQQSEPKDWYVIGLKTNYRDTVYAARRGIVSSLRDSAQLKLSDYTYSSEENYLELYHDDCSFGMYEVLSRIFLKLGQKVEAGDPIGLAGGGNYTSGAHIRFSVSYNHEELLSNNSNGGKKKVLYNAYVPLNFYTKESGSTRLVYGNKYTSEHPDSLIIQEMSKRELTKWNKHKSLDL
jgi:hypothetical protein